MGNRAVRRGDADRGASGQDFVDDAARPTVGQPLVPAVALEEQLLVIQAEQMQQRGLVVGGRDDIDRGAMPELVGGPIGAAWLEPAAGQPDAEALAVVVPAAVAFLSGTTPGGRLGVGSSAIRAAKDVTAAEGASLSIEDVRATLAEVADVSGAGSTARRVGLLRDLFARATGVEQDFLVRLLYGELRQGALEGVLVDAVARAAEVPPATVRRAAMLAGDLGVVARAALTGGVAALDAFGLKVLQPVQPMLADSADDVVQAVASLGEAALEYKLDGARIQVHKAGDEVAVYSRALNPVTGAVPEVVEAVRALPANTVILDGEVIALVDSTRAVLTDAVDTDSARITVAELREHTYGLSNSLVSSAVGAVGVDAVDVKDFVADLADDDATLAGWFHASELEDCEGDMERLAARFAAKEAALKALGTGIRGLDLMDITIQTAPNGATSIDLSDPARQMLALTAIEAVTDELQRACEAVAPDEGEPDPAALRAALARATVLLTDLARWAGGVG